MCMNLFSRDGFHTHQWNIRTTPWSRTCVASLRDKIDVVDMAGDGYMYLDGYAAKSLELAIRFLTLKKKVF